MLLCSVFCCFQLDYRTPFAKISGLFNFFNLGYVQKGMWNTKSKDTVASLMVSSSAELQPALLANILSMIGWKPVHKTEIPDELAHDLRGDIGVELVMVVNQFYWYLSATYIPYIYEVCSHWTKNRPTNILNLNSVKKGCKYANRQSAHLLL